MLSELTTEFVGFILNPTNSVVNTESLVLRFFTQPHLKIVLM